jgi:menaquinone-dependent protoporphyrinogen IX oxidase
MKVMKKIVILLVSGVLLVMAYFQFFYDPCGWRSSPGLVNNGSPFILVIANEGSHFKDSIARILLRHYETEKVQVNVIPLSSLSDLKTTDYTALVILHSWYTWKPPPEVDRFIKKQRRCLDQIVVLTTSTEGSLQMDAVDAITGASKMKEAVIYANKIIERINSLPGSMPASANLPE